MVWIATRRSARGLPRQCVVEEVFLQMFCAHISFFNFCPSVDRNKGRRGKKVLVFLLFHGGGGGGRLSLVSAVLGKPEAAATLCSSATNILGKIATNQSMTEFNCSAFFISFGGWILQSVSRTDSCFEYELLCICKVVVCHPSSQ